MAEGLFEGQPHCSKKLKGQQSAQRAEITAVTAALQLAQDKTTNIYTDSAYAHVVVHTAMAEWQRNDFMTATGVPIKHYQEILKLKEALMMAKAVAVLKCKGHTKKDDFVSAGNDAADKAAKAAAGYLPTLQLVVSETELKDRQEVTEETVKIWQEQGSPEERSMWKSKGGERDEKGVWRKGGKCILPQKQLKLLISEAHGACHVGVEETLRRLHTWWHPFMRAIVKNELQDCSVCSRYNSMPTTKPPQGTHDPDVTAPGQVVPMDFTDMIESVSGYRYLLVIVDSFSGWPEAYPCKTETANVVVKHLINHYIPSHGFPNKIRSDNGTHFKNKHLQEVEKALGLKHTFGSVYHPQSQGQVERMNRNIKEKLAKALATSNLNWLQALPLALMNVRMSFNSAKGWTPFECHTNRPFPAPTAALETTDVSGPPELKQLTLAFLQLTAKQPDAPLVMHESEFVWLKVIKRKWSEPRWTGPHEVTERTSSAVRPQGKGDTWYHLTSTRPAKTPSRQIIIATSTDCTSTPDQIPSQ
ncbi:uncharacterized protein K02A2.6-like [Phycodurus eques]|uniref:uncharacterized protein K02A2.6-like n=1 Tax=Phycodurus eques TaxID=693459 RepID=UPI002ACE6BAE|nr:uncharacterized protein K02A2.6-like [Phycodurus eques]